VLPRNLPLLALDHGIQYSLAFIFVILHQVISEKKGGGRSAHFLFVVTVNDIEKILEQTLTGLGFDLVDFQRQNHGRNLKIFIDAAHGVSVDDCASVSHHLTRLFAVENVDFDHLEVSSPGLDRPLKKLQDFTRFIGETVRVKLKMAIEGQRNFVGILARVDERKIDLDVDGVMMSFDFDNLGQARLVPKISWRRE
jgi:ribosome maturation factor RimP